MENYQNKVLLLGCFFLALFLIGAAFSQYRNGQTYGATGKSMVSKDKNPVYFQYLGVIRIILGLALLFFTIISFLRI